MITGSACFKNCHRISRKVTGVRSHVFTRAPAHGTNIHASHRFIFHRYITVVSVSLPLHDSARSLSSLEKTMIHRVHRDLPFRHRSSSPTFVTFSTFMLDFLPLFQVLKQSILEYKSMDFKILINETRRVDLWGIYLAINRPR